MVLLCSFYGLAVTAHTSNTGITMRQFAVALFLTVLVQTIVSAQPVLVQTDNGQFGGHHVGQNNAPLPMWEESAILKPDGPCRILEIHVFFDGNTPGKDTVYVVGDPSEGVIPPTNWVWSYNTLIPPIVVDYNGQQGWRSIDVRGKGLRSDGYDRIIIQHRLSKNGPWFAVDNNGTSSPLRSFLFDPHRKNSLGFPGVYYRAAGDYMVRLLVQYDYPSGNSSQPPPPATFVDVARNVGLTDANGNPLKSVQISVVDWNSDGFDDIAIGGKFFQNKGNGTFENVTSDLGISGGATIWGDIDNDGDQDVYAVSGGKNDKVYRNNGDGTFTDVTAASGLSNPYPTVTPIWFDYNNDGLLDLFIANGRRTVNNQETYYPDQLWRNEGGMTFTNVTTAAGIASGEPPPYYDCWGASVCDYNNDGYTDIFVSTYRLAPDLLYRNNKNGTFTEVGAATRVRGVPTADPRYYGHGMGSDWGDFDNDGDLDLVVGNLGHPDWRGMFSNPSLIFRNDGAPNFMFTEVHKKMGLKFFEMNAGVAWLDFDHDGYLDLWSCQYAYRKAGDQGEPVRLSRMYHNEGPPDYRLRDVTWQLGSVIHGAWTVARIDYDNDGDVDLLVGSPTEAVKLFRNDAAKQGNWISFRLEGSPGNNVSMDAVGTMVRVKAGGRTFTRVFSTAGAGSRAAQSSAEIHFGLGQVNVVDEVNVRFSDGTQRTFKGLQPDRKYRITYDGGISTGVDRTGAAPGGWMVSGARYGDGRIWFELESNRTVRNLEATVYNILGAEIARVNLGDRSPGTQSFRVHPRPARGLYFMSLRAGKQAHIARVAVVR